MSTKSIIITLVGIIVIGGATYFAMSKKQNPLPANISPVSTTQNEIVTPVKEPTKDASTDEIIDYLVDTQSEEEMKAAKATLDTSPTSLDEPTISTNF
jgi:hypothetical protein